MQNNPNVDNSLTQRKLIEDILLLAVGGRLSDDYLLDYDQVRQWTNEKRAILIKEFVQKHQKISTSFAQSLGCINLVCVDKAECCDFGIGEYYKKLEVPLPTLIDLSGYSPITFVGLVDKITTINVVDPYYAQFAKHSMFTGNQRRAFPIGNQIYFDLPEGDKLSKVNIRAILFDPREANNFSQCGGCYDEDVDTYPVAAPMLGLIKQLVLDRDLGLQLKTQSTDDKANDSMSTKISNFK